MSALRPEVAAILPEDHAVVAKFLHAHLNPRVPVAAWRGLLAPAWTVGECGCVLRVHGDVVGAYIVVPSRRPIGSDATGKTHDVRNLAAFCVREEYRAHSLRLVRQVLARKDVVYTDLSPSGNVPAMNARLGFQHLDTRTRLSLNLPGATHGVRVTDDPDVIAAVLSGRDVQVYQDHRGAAAARHLVATSGERYAYLMYRRDARKRLHVFASPLYVGGDADLLAEAWRGVGAHLLRRGYLATLAEHRVMGFTLRGIGVDVTGRPKMYRGSDVDEGDIDYLYSELTLLEW